MRRFPLWRLTPLVAALLVLLGGLLVLPPPATTVPPVAAAPAPAPTQPTLPAKPKSPTCQPLARHFYRLRHGQFGPAIANNGLTSVQREVLRRLCGDAKFRKGDPALLAAYWAMTFHTDVAVPIDNGAWYAVLKEFTTRAQWTQAFIQQEGPQTLYTLYMTKGGKYGPAVHALRKREPASTYLYLPVIVNYSTLATTTLKLRLECGGQPVVTQASGLPPALRYEVR